MASLTIPLTQAECEAALPRFLDDGTPKTKLINLGYGLLLQITPSKPRLDGTYAVSRSWLFRFSLDGREQRMGLDPLDRLPLNRARVKALALQEQVDQKVNPLDEARRQRHERERKREARKAGAKTFKACAEAYIAAQEVGWTSSVYRRQWKDTLARFAYPVIGDLSVADVTKAHVLQILQPLWATKTTTAKGLRTRIATVLDYAAAQNYRPREGNPAAWEGNLAFDLAKPSRVRPKRHHPALDYENISQFMAKLRKEPGAAARALEFAILTASRSGEVRFAKWSEIDLERRLWTVPAVRMKMRGDPERGDHIVPLSDAAIAILMAIKGDETLGPDELIFKGRFGARLAEGGLRCACNRINPDIAVHAFRSCFSDWVGDCTDASEETREFCLAHVKRGVAGAYRHKTAVEKRRVLLEQWADYCGTTEPANIIPLKRTA
jgi:integrase